MSTSLLLSLPNELLANICTHIDQEGCSTLCYVSQRLRAIAEPCLYKNIRVVDGKGGHFMRTFQQRPQLASLIKNVTIDYRKYEPSGYALAPILEMCPNLQEFHLTAVFWNFDDAERRDDLQGYFNVWADKQQKLCQLFERNSLLTKPESRILPALEACTLQFLAANDDSELWSLSIEECLISATLRKLIIGGCFLQDGDGDMWLPFTGQTPLEELHLRDCNLNVRSLSLMLALPRGLKRLYLEQTEGDDVEPPSKRGIKDAMKSQMHSLEYLEVKTLFTVLNPADRRYHSVFGDDAGQEEDTDRLQLADFDAFEKLETIRVGAYCREDQPLGKRMCYEVEYTCQRTNSLGVQGNVKWATQRIR